MRIKLLPLDELAPEVSWGFAHLDDSQLSLPSAHKVRPILTFDIFVRHVQRPSWDYSSPNARSKSAAHKVRPILTFDIFVRHVQRPSWDYSSPNARSKSARALQNASKPCRY